MRFVLKYTVWVFFFIALIGCAKSRVYYPGNGAINTDVSAAAQLNARVYWEKIKQLRQELTALSATVDPTEAGIIAETAIRESAVLAQEYQLVRPAIAHNLLVALGIKDRGLCWQWTEDLLKHFQALNLRTFKLHWAVAYRGSELREHNCVVITAREQSFDKGIVLDPWRNSGSLFWAQVTEDRYPWKLLPPSDW